MHRPTPRAEDLPLLARLPPGRHGLPREFVAENQRARIIAATIAVVAERGFPATRVSDIAAAAGLSRRSFYAHHRDKRACFLATFAKVEGFLGAEAAAAAAAAEGWRAKLAAALAAILDAFAANPDLARFLLAAPQQAGTGLFACYAEMIGRLAAAAAAADPRLPPPAMLEPRLAGLAAVVLDGVNAGQDPRPLAEELIALASAWLPPGEAQRLA